MSETIFALATPPGRSALAVVRISGASVEQALGALGVKPSAPRRASLRKLSTRRGEAVDQALVIRFPAPHSYTGEDMAELHLHGGEATVAAISEFLLENGLRPAEPGEMTRRAFENGKLDLAQAEAVADLIDAQTSAQARQALGQLEGALGRRHEAWRRDLLATLARLEAAIDFADEDLPAAIEEEAEPPLRRLIDEIDLALADQARGQRIREGYRIAVIGAPNSGKSSLFNALLGRDAAIVAPEPGSTRDVIEANLDLGAYRAVLADMAGMRLASNAVEKEGVRRAMVWAQEADVRLWVVDQGENAGIWREGACLAKEEDLCLLNKSDLPSGADAAAAACCANRLRSEVMRTSVLGEGADSVRTWLERRVRRDLSGGDFPAITRVRHARILREAKEHLAAAHADLRRPELASEGVRLAARALGRISGDVGAEDVLGEIFSQFCIGK
ncbi:MAG: tRNA uridine-5-carboxymethylaminomethyl(34) synthesis GTPase MnmE [Caulobacteraceae bacterium]